MKINAISNIIGSLFFAITSILLFPIYLNFLGPEKYGLFTFFFVIQIYFRLLDFGTSATLTRYVALKNKQNDGILFIRNLIFSYEIFFFILTLLIIILAFISSDFIANKWITTYSISTQTISNCLKIISFIVCLKFFTALYRGALNGFELQLWLNILRVSIEFTCFYIGILIYHFFFGNLENSIFYLFIFYLFIYLIEFLFARVKLYRHLIIYKNEKKISFFAPLKETFKFSIMITFSSSVWIFITWSDKIIWSSIFDLKYYGYFVTISVISSSSLFFITPINTALLAGLTRYLNKYNFNEVENIFYKANLISLFIIFSIATLVISYPKQILYAWTGNLELANWGYKPMITYTMGYSIIAISHTYFTYASSVNKLYEHTILSLVWGFLVLISFIAAALYFDLFISGIFWTICNILFIMVFVIIFFNVISPEMNYKKIFVSSFRTFLFFLFSFLILFLLNIDLQSGRILICSKLILIFIIITITYLLIFRDVALSVFKIFKFNKTI